MLFMESDGSMVQWFNGSMLCSDAPITELEPQEFRKHSPSPIKLQKVSGIGPLHIKKQFFICLHNTSYKVVPLSSDIILPRFIKLLEHIT
jgi:hypothetical protein